MRKRGLILASFLVAMMTNALLAEEKQDITGNTVTLEPITITSSRTERRLSEVPSYVSVISEEEIKDSNAKSVPDLLKNLEGIYMYDASGVGTSGRINMRGFWGGMSTHQLVLIDGIPQNKGKDKLVDWDLIPLDNIERIEIVRGPVSALYGDNAMSGVINIITKKPSINPETKISASYGSFNTQNYEISTSRLGYYVGVSRKSTDGFRRHCDYENINLNGKLDFLTSDMQNLRISLDYHEKERGAHPWAITETQVEQDRRQARPGTENDKENAVKLDTSLTFHKEMDDMCHSDIEGTFYYRYEDSESFFTSGSTGSSTEEQLGVEDTYGLLLRYSIKQEMFGVANLITTGVDLERNNFDYKEYDAPYQVRGALQNNYDVIRDKVGPYIQDEIELFKPLRFIIGCRYDSVEFDFSDRENSANSKKTEMSQVTPNYGAVYSYQKDSNIYANYSWAFRTPTIGQMFTYGSFSNTNLNPEEAKNYETGIRHYFNDYLKLKASFYWMELDNEIWYDSANSHQYKNYGKTSHKGIETGLDFKINKNLDTFFNYTYTRAKNESGDYNGKYLTNIPIHKCSLGMKFEIDPSMDVHLIFNRVGSSYLDSANDDTLSGYTTIDTKAIYKCKEWTAFFAVDNLLDEKYNSYGYKKSGTKYFNPAPDRAFTFGMEVKF